MTVSDYKLCNYCGQEKPVSEFYERQTRCKSCMIKISGERRHLQSPKQKLATVFGSEGLVVQALRAMGIPAYPGKSVSFARVDVVAWGCVGIEVKSSMPHGYEYQWGFTKKQLTSLQSDVIILVMTDRPADFFVFDSAHPVFYINGKRKKGIVYNPISNMRKHYDRCVMSFADMEQARNNWDIVEKAKQEFCQQLKLGVSYPQWLR